MTPWMAKSTFLERWGLRLFMVTLAVVMLFPIVYVVAVSLSSYEDVVNSRLIIFPAHPTLEAYRWVLQGTGVLRGLGVSFYVAILGTFINMLLTTTMAYGLSRRSLPGHKIFLWMVLLTLLIAPTIITKYLVVRQLGMINTLWALMIPGAIAPFNLIVMRQFFLNLPSELTESAKLDGASDLRIFWSIVLPLSKAPLAAITLFYAVGHWNSFFDAVLYLNDPQLYPISVILRLMVLQGTNAMDQSAAGEVPPPDLTIQMAVVVLATLPILIIYPFLQRYFTKGVLTGSIKG